MELKRSIDELIKIEILMYTHMLPDLLAGNISWKYALENVIVLNWC